MNTNRILILALGASLALASSSIAAPRNWSKGTGNYDDSMSHRPTARARRSYQSVAPRVIQEAPAPEAVASAPSTTRRYSYEPSMTNGHCGSTHAAAKADDSAKTAQTPSGVRSTRRYSYEPGTRTYSAPRSRPAWTNPNSLPKSDPRRHNF
jgi:hypothetical protein